MASSNNPNPRPRTIGLLGGGQLGRMLVESANRLNMPVNILDAEGSSAKQICPYANHITGSFTSEKDIRRLAEKSDILTIEIEHVNTQILRQVSSDITIEPDWSTIEDIQDKYTQKMLLRSRSVAVGDFYKLDLDADIAVAIPDLIAEDGAQFPLMLKARRSAYDGRGNYVLKSPADIEPAKQALGTHLYVEKWAPFTKELAVMVVKTSSSILSFPTVETVHEDSICTLVYAPARGITPQINQAAQDLARSAVHWFDGRGVFGVELFLMPDNTLLVNEIAPRPHNSGHYTIEACGMSQFDAHLRAILDKPIPEESLHLEKPAIMLNILGGATATSHLTLAKMAESVTCAHIHLYGKGDARPGRKMGHATVTAPSMNEAERRIHPLKVEAERLRAERLGREAPLESPPPPLRTPLVGITTGSTSDQAVLEPAYELLDSLHVPYEKRITSAHRTPSIMADYASSAAARGVKVIIAAAGGAAHLPGMVEAFAGGTMPVIGLPIKPSIGDGWDSLVSCTNMPNGKPVLTVGVNKAENAALAAASIVAVGDERLRQRLRDWHERAAAKSEEGDNKFMEENERRLRG